MDLDIQALIGYLRRWWWLAVGLPILVAGLVFLIVSQQTPLYSATATLRVDPPSSTVGTATEAQIGAFLAQTYQDLITTHEVLAPVAAGLGGDFTVPVLQSMVTSNAPANKFLLRISATDADPAQAALLANAVAEEFTVYLQREDEGRLAEILFDSDQLIEQERAAVGEARARLEELEREGAADDEILQATTEFAATRQQLSDSEARRADLRATGALQQAQVQLAARAQPPTAPYAPRTLFYTVLGLMMGVALAGGLIVVVEYLDNTVKPHLNFPELISAPLMAVVPAASKRFMHGKEQLFMRTQAASTMAESIRLLRTNIEFAAAAKEISTLAVTSSEPSEGKSTITANLATGMAQTGFTVAVIDADMRRPNQHRIFGVPNTTGLTTLLTRETVDWKTASHEIMEGLWLITSGPIPPNPADLLSSDRFRATIDQILATVDVVLIDTPPLLVVSDPLVVATKTDATLLVARSGSTRIETLRRAANVLHQSGVRLIGIALNLESGRNAQGYYYYYDSAYYTSPEEPTLDATPIPQRSLATRPDHAR